jgi:hypothetical protein
LFEQSVSFLLTWVMGVLSSTSWFIINLFSLKNAPCCLFHCNYQQTGVSETNVSASTGKSACKCENCTKLARDSTNKHSIDNINRKEVLSAIAPRLIKPDNYQSLSDYQFSSALCHFYSKLCIFLPQILVRGLCVAL